jgi:2'-5' RNA ligase
VIGFAAEERAWSPHLTLARAPREGRAAASVPDAFFAQDFEISWQPAELTRVVSHAGMASGERYEIAARFPLKMSA